MLRAWEHLAWHADGEKKKIKNQKLTSETCRQIHRDVTSHVRKVNCGLAMTKIVNIGHFKVMSHQRNSTCIQVRRYSQKWRS